MQRKQRVTKYKIEKKRKNTKKNKQTNWWKNETHSKKQNTKNTNKIKNNKNSWDMKENTLLFLLVGRVAVDIGKVSMGQV